MLTKHGEKAKWELQMNAMYFLEQILEATLNKIAAVWSPASHLTNYSSKTNKTSGALLEKQG